MQAAQKATCRQDLHTLTHCHAPSAPDFAELLGSFFVRVCLICLRSLVFAAALQLIFQDNGPRGGVEK